MHCHADSLNKYGNVDLEQVAHHRINVLIEDQDVKSIRPQNVLCYDY